MSHIDDEIQEYLDACQDVSCFCRGVITTNSMFGRPRSLSNHPNCGVRDKCRLFRAMPISIPARMFLAQGSNPENGCHPYEYWQKEKDRQAADSREWVVSMCGSTMVVTGRDTLSAAINMFRILREDGIAVDKAVLLERQYAVREK